MLRVMLLTAAAMALSGVALAAPMPWPYNMTIERCEVQATGFVVETTGAVFELMPARGEIVFAQRISAQRRLGVLRLGLRALAGLRVTSQDTEVVAFTTAGGLRLAVHCDSVLRIEAPQETLIRVDGGFTPEYWAVEQSVTMALDESGGVGVYFLSPAPERARAERRDAGFAVRQELLPGAVFLLSVCPPREYNWQQQHEERIVHFFPEGQPGFSPRPLPTDEELVEWRKLAKVLVLHLEAWDGFGVQHIRPRDPERFRQVIDKAHGLGYLVLPYSSCFYYMPARQPDEAFKPRHKPEAVEMYLAEAEWLLNEYKVDGLYWDGMFADPLMAWEAARRTRKLLGTRRLYVHCTFEPFFRLGVYCPFADTYADYILRGETFDKSRINPERLRYWVSGLNISNSIGTLCWETCRPDREMMDWSLQANVLLPFWPGGQAVGERRYYLLPEEEKLYREYYVPASDAVRGPEDYTALAAEGRQTRARWRARAAEELARAEAALAAYLAAQRGSLTGRMQGNLAAFRPVKCSDYTATAWGMPHGLGYRPEYATDGNTQTCWGADYPPHWVSVDLGNIETISAVRVTNYHGDERFYHYRVELSTDSKTWTQVAEKTDDALATAEGTLHRFAPCQARHVRVVMLSNSANCGVHVAEIEAYR
ncbi:MAG: discoidin domain-containing protein [Armatimonadetes bacterium]|nr:discoidin domain-containing protein [Armatimonadota bacterium]